MGISTNKGYEIVLTDDKNINERSLNGNFYLEKKILVFQNQNMQAMQ